MHAITASFHNAPESGRIESLSGRITRRNGDFLRKNDRSAYPV